MPVHLMLCCNHPENGRFSARLDALDLDDGDGDIALELEGEPIRLRFLTGRGRFHSFESADRGEARIRLGRVQYPILRHQTWVGNWVWDQITMRDVHVPHLLQQLRDQRWTCTSACEPYLDLWDDPTPIPEQWRRIHGVELSEAERMRLLGYAPLPGLG